MKVNNEDYSQILYEEKLSKYIVFGESYKSINQITRSIWSYRLGAIIIILLFYYLYSYLNFFYWGITIGLSILFIYLILVSLSEKTAYVSATPIIIRNNGIQMYSSPLQRLLGHDGFVSKDEIRSIVIHRNNVLIESTPEAKSRMAIRWRDVPAEFIIQTKSGRKHRSGRKHPEKISKMVAIMRTEWGIPIFDKHDQQITDIKFEPGREERL